ncbi:hypothetical protein JRO89_XS07G0025600 [Xanthoceras sorbifolium]|uniref:Uncharacterized protein n=1 Tax=Xanthoceras sorbifolium TaxID=99658 RepID=A0ABQ8HS65_9ROSI|nr:hypothetical protein JRO89_XS07G0025600 [Xanthoceras sorbifolium]
MKKAEEEIRYLIGKKGFVDEDDIQRLSYLEAVVKETMRLQPSGCDNIRCGSKVSMWRQGSGWSRLPWCLRSWCPRRCRTEALRLLRRRNNTNQIEFGTALGSVSLSVAGLTKTKRYDERRESADNGTKNEFMLAKPSGIVCSLVSLHRCCLTRHRRCLSCQSPLSAASHLSLLSGVFVSSVIFLSLLFDFARNQRSPSADSALLFLSTVAPSLATATAYLASRHRRSSPLSALCVGDYVGEQGGANYSAQFKNLEKLVKSLDTEILAILHVTLESIGYLLFPWKQQFLNVTIMIENSEYRKYTPLLDKILEGYTVFVFELPDS